MKNKDKKTILVTGATGKQGGAVARHLVNHGWHVRLLCRDPNKPAVEPFREMGVDIVRGNLDDCDSVLSAARGAYGIYSVQSLEQGTDVECRQGKLLAEVAKQCNTQHFVYSSVASAHRKTYIPHFESKWQVEEHIRSLNLPATIFRPVWFMDNFLMPQYRINILEGKLSMPLRPEKPLQMIAVDNIGAFVALAFEHPEQYICKAIDIAGDELTMPEVTEKIGKVIERRVRYVEMPIEQMRETSTDWAVMFEWFNDFGYNVDIAYLRQTLPELLDFETWLHKFGWEHFVREKAAASAV